MLKLVVSIKNLEEVEPLEIELALMEEYTFPRWAYIASEWVSLSNKKSKLRNKINKLYCLQAGRS